MTNIPKTVHYVFGMREQLDAFHLLHYMAIESCRRVLNPDRIYLYYHHLPYGLFWDLIRPHLTLVHVPLADEVERFDYAESAVPELYRYAHHSDVVRLDALIRHGGIYADIDTLFLRPLPEDFYQYPFVMSREAPILDERSGEVRPSLCNAIMMAEPQARFARVWRDRIGEEMNGSWSNHSCQLAHVLSNEMPDAVHIEPAETFLGIPLTPEAISALLEGGELDTADSYAVHLWEHLWWDYERRDFSNVHARQLTPDYFLRGETPLARMGKPFLPDLDFSSLGPAG